MPDRESQTSIPVSGSIGSKNGNSPKTENGLANSLSPARVGKPRITLTWNCCYQEPERQSTALAGSVQRFCESSDDQSYHRRIKVGEEWSVIDHGWLSGASLLILINEEGKFTQVVPTEMERVAAFKRVVQVGLITKEGSVIPFLEVRPQESFPLPVTDLSSLRLRCLFGEARCTVDLYPR